MFVLVRKKPLPATSVLDKHYTELKFRPHRSKGMHFSTSGDILLDQYARPIFQMLYTSALSRRKKFSFSSQYNPNKKSIQDHFFLTKHCLKCIIISKNIFFLYSNHSWKSKSFHLSTAFEYSKHFYILLIWTSKQPWSIIPTSAEKETKAESK